MEHDDDHSSGRHSLEGDQTMMTSEDGTSPVLFGEHMGGVGKSPAATVDDLMSSCSSVGSSSYDDDDDRVTVSPASVSLPGSADSALETIDDFVHHAAAPVIVFHYRNTSHHFTERRIVLNEQVKVGRAVNRIKPLPNNAIFDCKVLSRNHAVIYYSSSPGDTTLPPVGAKGHFFLQDTRSSNGTFVNGMSIGKQDAPGSGPVEVFTDDVIQFGVNVVENAKKTTHACIVTSISCYHSDGIQSRRPVDRELGAVGGVAVISGASPLPQPVVQLLPGAAVPTSAASVFGSSMMQQAPTAIYAQDLFQLTQYVQESLHREQLLDGKLMLLQRLLHDAQSEADRGWQALVDEERLLSKLESLDAQLQVYATPKEGLGAGDAELLKQQLCSLQQEKHASEMQAKESLRQVLDEKLATAQRLADVERLLGSTEHECARLRDACDVSQRDLQRLSDQHREQTEDVDRLRQQLHAAEQLHLQQQEAALEVQRQLQAITAATAAAAAPSVISLASDANDSSATKAQGQGDVAADGAVDQRDSEEVQRSSHEFQAASEAGVITPATSPVTAPATIADEMPKLLLSQKFTVDTACGVDESIDSTSALTEQLVEARGQVDLQLEANRQLEQRIDRLQLQLAKLSADSSQSLQPHQALATGVQNTSFPPMVLTGETTADLALTLASSNTTALSTYLLRLKSLLGDEEASATKSSDQSLAAREKTAHEEADTVTTAACDERLEGSERGARWDEAQRIIEQMLLSASKSAHDDAAGTSLLVGDSEHLPLSTTVEAAQPANEDTTQESGLRQRHTVASDKKDEADLETQLCKLREQLADQQSDLTQLRDKTFLVSVCSMVPLAILLVALLMVFYEPLSRLTATTND